MQKSYERNEVSIEVLGRSTLYSLAFDDFSFHDRALRYLVANGGQCAENNFRLP